MRQSISLACAVILLFPNMAQSCDSLTSITWLLGDWQSHKGNAVRHEQWQQVSEQTFEGAGWKQNETGEVTGQEALMLAVMRQGVFYFAKVDENPLPIPFKAVSCTPTQAVFENPQHDFPQRLSYTLHDDQQLTVAVQDLQGQGFTLSFTRK